MLAVPLVDGLNDLIDLLHKVAADALMRLLASQGQPPGALSILTSLTRSYTSYLGLSSNLSYFPPLRKGFAKNRRIARHWILRSLAILSPLGKNFRSFLEMAPMNTTSTA